jgi:RNA polymerase sigma-70 factor (ECF subfamily)
MIFAGGVPLKRAGKIVRAFGVSGGSGEQDHAVAEAGAAVPQSHSGVGCEMQSDKTLIAAMLEGNEAAFRTFFENYFPRVYRFALLRLHGDVEAAKDVVQSTLIKAVRGLAGFRSDATLFSWLCQICRHQIVDYLRMQKRHTQHVVSIDDCERLRATLESISAPITDEPLHRYDAAQMRRCVQYALDSLPDRYADVLRWKYIEERSVAEIGESLGGTGHAAAQSLLARARAALREELSKVFGSTARDILGGMHGNQERVKADWLQQAERRIAAKDRRPANYNLE